MEADWPKDEKDVLRWGGLAGILGGVLSLLFIVILVAVVPIAPSDPSALVARFPSVRLATLVGETIYLGAVILWAILLIGLYRALRGGSKAPAIFGSGLGLIGDRISRRWRSARYCIQPFI